MKSYKTLQEAFHPQFDHRQRPQLSDRSFGSDRSREHRCGKELGTRRHQAWELLAPLNADAINMHHVPSKPTRNGDQADTDDG